MTAVLEILEGFEATNGTDLARRGWGGNSMTTVSNPARSGSYACSLSSGTYTTLYLPTLQSAARSVVCGCGFNPQNQGTGTIASFGISGGPFNSSGSQLVFRWNAANRAIDVYRGYANAPSTAITGTLLGSSPSGTAPMVQGVWSYFEFRIFVDSTNGYIQILSDGLQILELTNVNTQYLSGVDYINKIVFSVCSVSGTVNAYYDDVYVYSDTASTLTTQQCIADARVLPVAPVADGGYAQFTPSVGVSHYALVDEVPFSSTDYVSSAAPTYRDTYKFTSPSGYPYIHGVKSCFYAGKTDGGFRACKLIATSDATTTTGMTLPLSLTPFTLERVYQNNPHGDVTWTAAGVASAEFGVEVV